MAVAKARTPQPQLELRTREEIERDEADAETLSDELGAQLVALINGCKRVARELGYVSCAEALEKIWGRHGRHVTEPLLRACFGNVETGRNYFRVEWAQWFAQHSDEVVAILRTWGGVPTKTAEQELVDLKLTIAEEFPNQAKKMIRKAATR